MVKPKIVRVRFKTEHGYIEKPLEDRFQGFHYADECPFFKGGGCPNCRKTAWRVYKTVQVSKNED